MSVPTADQVVKALRKHPDLFAEVSQMLADLNASEPVIYEYRLVDSFSTVDSASEDGWRVVAVDDNHYILGRAKR